MRAKTIIKTVKHGKTWKQVAELFSPLSEATLRNIASGRQTNLRRMTICYIDQVAARLSSKQ